MSWSLGAGWLHQIFSLNRHCQVGPCIGWCMNGAGRLVEPSVLHGMSGRIGGVGRPRIPCSTDGETGQPAPWIQQPLHGPARQGLWNEKIWCNHPKPGLQDVAIMREKSSPPCWLFNCILKSYYHQNSLNLCVWFAWLLDLKTLIFFACKKVCTDGVEKQSFLVFQQTQRGL